VFAAYAYRWANPVPAESVFLPPNCVKAEDAPAEPVRSEGHLYWKAIVLNHPVAGPVEFVLVTPTKPEDPHTFYIMRDKVTRRLFREAIRNGGFQELLTTWRKSDADSVQPDGVIEKTWASFKWAEPGSDSEQNLPATMITVSEAYCFAKWLAGSDGTLPTEQQWDKAGGRSDGRPGPFDPSWNSGDSGIALNAKGPRPVGKSDKDVSFFGCQDMAGNGREFTRDVMNGITHSLVPLGRRATDDDYVRLRGHSYTASEPYRFGASEPLEHNLPRDDVGFRVVLELPVS
jgi:formylglycine-generating enzyme required for sulfatase activity